MPAYRFLQVQQLSSDFRKSTEIVHADALPTPQPGHVVVRNHFAGINATDVNVTNGLHGLGDVPFACGLEAAGVIASVGPDVDDFRVGDIVAYQAFGAFSEYLEVKTELLIKASVLSPALLPLTVCGVSASIALEQVGEMKNGGETVLVTAAAGGTGQFVVQLAKLAGNHVIGTCSSPSKVAYLKSLGCDRVINYTEEDIAHVLTTEYPNGVDLVFDGVGGDMMRLAVQHVAEHGRIITFGRVAMYKGAADSGAMTVDELTNTLLFKSASLRGFVIFNQTQHIPRHLARLLQLIDDNKLKAGIDPTDFRGLESVSDAVEHMFAKKNIGKVVVRLVDSSDE